MYSAKVIEDSICEGSRLTTMEVVFPRMVLSEFNTHRVFSRNSASSRAIPVTKQIRRVLENPFVPEEFGTNQPGMQSGPPLDGPAHKYARSIWIEARDNAVEQTLALIADYGYADETGTLTEALDNMQDDLDDGLDSEWTNVHKEIANRLLEPFMWHTVVVTATEWDNFISLRDHEEAQPQIAKVANLMKTALNDGDNKLWERHDSFGVHSWHLPYVSQSERVSLVAEGPDLAKVSSARCARVSYLTHDGIRDIEKDLDLADRLLEGGHMSPFEHPAMASGDSSRSGNFSGPWAQYRKMIPNESDPLGG